MKKLLLALSTLGILNGADPIQNNEHKDDVSNVKPVENAAPITLSYIKSYPHYFVITYEYVQQGNYLYLYNGDGTSFSYFRKTERFKK